MTQTIGVNGSQEVRQHHLAQIGSTAFLETKSWV